jgi:hypothetical protein
MSDLFGGTATPRWMAPEERDAILGQEGRANAASFDQAFQASYARQQQEALKEKEIQKTKDELKPIIEHAQGLDSTAAWLKVNQEHPEYLLSPRTQPYWMELGKNLMGADTIKQKSAEGQQEIQRVQEYGDWGKSFGLLNPAEKGQIAQIIQDSQGKLNDRGWRMVNGKPIGPDDDILGIVDNARKREGYSAFGMDKSERIQQTLSPIGKLQAERQRAAESGAPTEVLKAYDDAITKANVSPVDVAKARGEETRKTEDIRQEDRIELEKIKQEGRVDIEKLRGLSRKDSKGNTIGETDFINRHYNTVYASLRKNPAVDAAGNIETEAVSAQKTRQILARVYRSMTPTPKVEAPKPDASTNAPAAAPAPAASDKDPLGLFSK